MSESEKPRYGFASEEDARFPGYLMYDVINVCNARCVHCAYRRVSKSDDYRAMKITWDWFARTIDEAAKHGTRIVRLTADGEPLLHPDTPRMIARAVNAGIPTVNLTTNGSLLRGGLLDTILETPPHVMDISLDAFHESTYRRVREGLDFDRVKANVMELLGKRDPERTRVLVSMIRPDGDPGAVDEEVRLFEDYWRERVDFAVVRERHTNLNLTGRLDMPDDVQRWPCQHLWQRLVVDYRGHIRYCPIDWNSLSRIGTVDDITLAEAWRSPALDAVRAAHLRGDFNACAACGQCSDWILSPWDRGWSRLIKHIMDGDDS